MNSRPTCLAPLYLTWSPFPISPQRGEDAKERRGEGTAYYPRVICLVQVILAAHLSMANDGWMGFSPMPAQPLWLSSPGDQVG